MIYGPDPLRHWIPKEIWLSEQLSLMGKVFLVEIHSLNNERICYASNCPPNNIANQYNNYTYWILHEQGCWHLAGCGERGP